MKCCASKGMSFCYCHHCCCLMAPCWLQVINFGPSEINKTLLYLRHLLSSCHTECKSNYLADLFYWVQGKRKEQMETLICQTIFYGDQKGFRRKSTQKTNATMKHWSICAYISAKHFLNGYASLKLKKGNQITRISVAKREVGMLSTSGASFPHLAGRFVTISSSKRFGIDTETKKNIWWLA